MEHRPENEKDSSNTSSDITQNLRQPCQVFEKEIDKTDVIKEWDKLIDVLYKYLQVVRSRGGTMGHKVGYFYEKQKSLKDVFETKV